MDSAQEQVALLEDRLSILPADEIIDFEHHLGRMVDLAYRWDLWGAAYIINGGCSDDGFEYFRGWLVARGKAIFDAALRDPDTLADVADDENAECETFLSVALPAYKRASGKKFPDEARWVATGACRGDPQGNRWTDEDLPKMLPRLMARFAR